MRSAGSSWRKCCIARRRFVHPAGQRMARRDDGDHHQEARQIPVCSFRPGRCSRQIGRQSYAQTLYRPPSAPFRTERAQRMPRAMRAIASSNSPRQTLSHPPSTIPPPDSVEHQRAIEQCHAAVESRTKWPRACPLASERRRCPGPVAPPRARRVPSAISRADRSSSR